MGGVAGYARPVNPTWISTWEAHTNRGTPSTEPGTDYGCPIGTPVRSASSGVVVDIGTSIQPATGYYVTIDLDDGRRVRYLHLSQILVAVGTRLAWGQYFAYSGATGYGEQDWSWNVAETGGAHTHMTLWARQAYTFGRYATLDPELYMASGQGASGSNGGFLMALSDAQQQQVYDALVSGGLGGYYKTDALVNIIRSEIAPAIASIAAGGILYPGMPYSAFEAVVNAVRADGGTGVEIDEEEFAAKLAPTLAPLITANLSALSDADVARIATASADEQAKRLAT